MTSTGARLRAVADLLECRYVDPELGLAVADELRRRGDPAEGDIASFALDLARWLRERTGDGHLDLVVDRVRDSAEGSVEASGDGFDAEQEQRFYGAEVNHGFEAVRRLDAGIGYLDLRVFAPAVIAGDLAVAAMTLLAECPALLVDLRQNGGGHGDMVALLASYLVDVPTELSATYDRPTGTTSPMMTGPWVPGRRFGGSKPLYVLTSGRTFSAAEHLAYDLQAMGRATVVGERTGGGAHPFEYRRVDEQLVLALPERRSVNPVTGTDWEGKGVVPDVEVAATDALDVALRLALGLVDPAAHAAQPSSPGTNG